MLAVVVNILGVFITGTSTRVYSEMLFSTQSGVGDSI